MVLLYFLPSHSWLVVKKFFFCLFNWWCTQACVSQFSYIHCFYYLACQLLSTPCNDIGLRVLGLAPALAKVEAKVAHICVSHIVGMLPQPVVHTNQPMWCMHWLCRAEKSTSVSCVSGPSASLQSSEIIYLLENSADSFLGRWLRWLSTLHGLLEMYVHILLLFCLCQFPLSIYCTWFAINFGC